MRFVLKEKIQVTHLTPLALYNSLEYFMKQAELLLKIQHKIVNTNWSRVGKVYEGFQYSIIRHFSVIEQEINNLHVLFLLQSGQISKDKCRLSGRLVKALEHNEITLISLEKAIGIIEPYIKTFYELISKAVPTNFDEPVVERSRILSDLSGDDSSFSERMDREREMQSFVEDQLLTDEAKTVYIINYLHSFININCSNIMDRELIEVVIEIFLDTLIPYLEIINTWFTEAANTRGNSEWAYDTTDINLPKFLKPFMKEILQIRKSLMVIQIVRDELIIGADKEMKEEFRRHTTW